MVRFFSLLFLLIPTGTICQSVDDQGNSELPLEKSQEVTSLNNLSRKYFRHDQIKAMDYAHEALTLARSIEDKKGEASALNNIGVIHKNRGRLDKALNSYLESVRIQEAQKFIELLPSTYSNIGTVYALQREFNQANKFFQKALKRFAKADDRPQIIGMLNNIGNVFYEEQQNDSALSYYQKSLSLYERLGDKRGVFIPYSNMGNIYFKDRDYDQALNYFRKSLVPEKNNLDLEGQANALHSMGLVHKAKGDIEKALNYFNEALSIIQETSNKRLLAMIYQSLAETYFIKKDLFLAYSFLQLHTVANDSLYNEENSRRIAELESKYELETKENELKSLRSQNEIQELRIKNDNILIISIAVLSLMGIIFTAIRIKELKQIKKNKQLLEAKNNELQNQKLIIEDKNQNITESIDYAKSVQRAILQFRVSERLKENFFTFYRPKAIVSGDFFWYSGLEGKDIIAAVDCTGHGVAGAFMTVIGSSCLDQIVNTDQIVSPAAILDNLGKSVSHALKQSLNGRSDHGMDVALCLIDYDKHEIRFAGANRSLYFFQNEEFKEIKGTRRSVGNMEIEYDDFTEHIIPFSPGDSFYLATDGYADQFGGSRNKKFMTVKFKKLLASIQHVSLKEQKSRLRESFEEWQGYNEQTDDVLVIGFRT